MQTYQFQINASSDDTNCSRQDVATYPPTGSNTQNQDTSQYVNPKKDFFVGNTGPGGSLYYTNVLFMRWDTSAIPDNAIVQSAQLRVMVGSVGSPDNLNLVAEWYSWSSPLADANFTETPGTTALNYPISNFPYFSGGPPNRISVLDLSNAAANVNKTGFTGLRMGMSAISPPTGLNEVYFYAYDDLVYDPPQLIVRTTGPEDNVPIHVGGWRAA